MISTGLFKGLKVGAQFVRLLLSSYHRVVRSSGAKLVNGSGVFCSEYYMKMLGYFPDDTAEGWDPAGNPASLTS